MDRVLCQHPVSGRTGPWIDRWKYDLLRSALLEVLPGRGTGISVAELRREVRRVIGARKLLRLGPSGWSVDWYVDTVSADLRAKRLVECRGELGSVRYRRVGVPDQQPVIRSHARL